LARPPTSEEGRDDVDIASCFSKGFSMAPSSSSSIEEDLTLGGELVVLGLLLVPLAAALTPFCFDDDDHHNDACAVGRRMNSHVIRNINNNNTSGVDVVALVAILADRYDLDDMIWITLMW
jgi:hypothetical protein